MDVGNKHISPAAIHTQIAQHDFISKLPLDISRIIFALVKTDLPALARVSKDWKKIAYDEELYKKIVPQFRFGEDAWKTYLGDPGKEPLLPLCVFKTIVSEEGWLTFVPETINIEGNDGTVSVVPINPESMGEIVKTPKRGQPTGYAKYSWLDAINENRNPEKSHWVWISKERIGIDILYVDQENLVQARSKEGKKDTDVSRFLDTVVTLFMEKIRSGASNPGIRDKVDRLRVKEHIRGRHMNVGFEFGGLYVPERGHIVGNIAAAVARRSFGR